MNQIRAILVLALLTVALTTVPAAAQTFVCDGKTATIVGTEGNDLLLGTPGDDVIVGRGGNDVIRGFDGNDTICGDNGRDRLFGGKGNDTLFGGKKNDALKGDQGQDTLYGNEGKDRLIGGGADDTLEGGSGTVDRLTGKGGIDTCMDRQAATTLFDVTCEIQRTGPLPLGNNFGEVADRFISCTNVGFVATCVNHITNLTGQTKNFNITYGYYDATGTPIGTSSFLDTVELRVRPGETYADEHSGPSIAVRAEVIVVESTPATIKTSGVPEVEQTGNTVTTYNVSIAGALVSSGDTSIVGGVTKTPITVKNTSGFTGEVSWRFHGYNRDGVRLPAGTVGITLPVNETYGPNETVETEFRNTRDGVTYAYFRLEKVTVQVPR